MITWIGGGLPGMALMTLGGGVPGDQRRGPVAAQLGGKDGVLAMPGSTARAGPASRSRRKASLVMPATLAAEG